MKKILVFMLLINSFYFKAQSIDELWKAAQNEFSIGNYNLADSLYSKAIRIDYETKGKNFGLYYNRGICRYELNNFDLAVIDFESCLKIYPYYAPAYREMAKCYYVKHDFIASRMNIDKCYSITNKDLDNLILGMMTCISDTSIALGKEYYKKAKSINKDERVYGLYSIILNLNGEHEKALVELQKGYEKFSKSEHIREGFVVYYYILKDFNLMGKYVNLLGKTFPYTIKTPAFREKVRELIKE